MAHHWHIAGRRYSTVRCERSSGAPCATDAPYGLPVPNCSWSFLSPSRAAPGRGKLVNSLALPGYDRCGMNGPRPARHCWLLSLSPGFCLERVYRLRPPRQFGRGYDPRALGILGPRRLEWQALWCAQTFLLPCLDGCHSVLL